MCCVNGGGWRRVRRLRIGSIRLCCGTHLPHSLKATTTLKIVLLVAANRFLVILSYCLLLCLFVSLANFRCRP